MKNRREERHSPLFVLILMKKIKKYRLVSTQTKRLVADTVMALLFNLICLHDFTRGLMSPSTNNLPPFKILARTRSYYNV